MALKRIEFWGSAGTGKTTYYKRLLSENRNWITPSEARIKVVKSHFTYKYWGGKNWMIKNNLFKRYHPKWAKSRVAGFANANYNNLLTDDFGPWIGAFLDGYTQKSDFIAFAAISHMRLFVRTLEDIMVFKNYLDNDVVVWDEGLLQHISKSYALRRILEATEQDLRSPVFPNGIIYFTASSSITFRRRKERALDKTVTSNPNDLILNDSDLKALCQNNELSDASVLSGLGRAPIPVLIVNSEDSILENHSRISEFINSIA
jgi:hypothetical protein